jgi:hypothetical protein
MCGVPSSSTASSSMSGRSSVCGLAVVRHYRHAARRGRWVALARRRPAYRPDLAAPTSGGCQLRGRCLRPKTSKGRRSLALDPATVAALREHWARQLEQRLAVGPRWQDSGLVITWPDGRPIHPERFSRWFEQHARDAGLPKIRLHDVRHSYATAALAAGVPTKVVSERLGHATFAITMDTYSHVLPGLDAQAADTVARLILGDGEQEPTRPVDKASTIGRKASGRGEEVKGERPGRRGVRAEGFEPPRPRTPGPKPGASAGSATLASRSSSLQQRSSGSCSAKRMGGTRDRAFGPSCRAGASPTEGRP